MEKNRDKIRCVLLFLIKGRFFIIILLFKNKLYNDISYKIVPHGPKGEM